MPKNAKFSLRKQTIKAPSVDISDVLGIVADILSIGATFATIYGLGKYVGGSSSKIAISLNETPFALRFILIVVIATALGWAYGSLSLRLTNTNKEFLHVFSLILALIFAAILVAASEMVAEENSKGILPQVHLFTLIGLAIVMWLCRFQYRAHAQYVGSAVMNRRAIGLLVFAATTVFVLILLELG